jgi:phosphoribosyl 1,2-cyclic phosphodiesterase
VKAVSLQSGSKGNCIYVETSGGRFLVDAGLSARETERRLSLVGRRLSDITALLVTHEHADHSLSAATLSRRYGIPAYVTPATEEAIAARKGGGCLASACHFSPGDCLDFGGVRVETVPTPHDSVEGSVFVINDCGLRLGILTDLGHVFGELQTVVRSLDALFLESNYDPGLLQSGKYPAFLKARIKGPGGHISNDESARLVEGAGRLFSWVCLAHLSGENNTPGLAVDTHRKIAGPDQTYHVAPRERLGEMLVVEKAVVAGKG